MSEYSYNITMGGEPGITVEILTPQGVPALCPCGTRAVGCRTNTLNQTAYYCAEHDPAGPPCPLCAGSGRLAP